MCSLLNINNITGGMGRIFDREGGFNRKKKKKIDSLPPNICLGREQGSVMLEIKFQFPLHNITSYH